MNKFCYLDLFVAEAGGLRLEGTPVGLKMSIAGVNLYWELGRSDISVKIFLTFGFTELIDYFFAFKFIFFPFLLTSLIGAIVFKYLD